MTKKKVYVAMLNEGTVSAGWESRIYAWMLEKAKNYEFNIFFPVGRPIPDNRHKIVKRFLGGDWDYLVMLDDDNPCYKNIFDLLDFDLPVVGGIYPGKSDRGVHFHVYKIDDSKEEIVFRQYPLDFRNGLKKVDAIGTGLMVIKREVLEKIGKLPFEDTFSENGELLNSDDLSFCLKCRDKGIDIYAHFDYLGSHFKTVDLMWVADLLAYAAQTGKTNFPDEKA